MKIYICLLSLFWGTVGNSYGQAVSRDLKDAYYCSPCDQGCDTIAYDHPGICPICHMDLVRTRRRGTTESLIDSNFVGHWKGTAHTSDQNLRFSVDIVGGADPTILFSAGEIGARNVNGVRISTSDKQLHFELPGDDATMIFDGSVSNDTIAGRFTTDDRSPAVENRTGTFELERTTTPPTKYSVRDTLFNNGEVRLAGSLYMPSGPGLFAAVVCNHSSGDQQRYDGAFMADFLASRGIAVLIYDKRGDGKSAGNWKTASFEDLADDCIAGVRLLKTIPSLDSNAIGIFGHSQGATFSPIIISRCPDIAFNVAAAGFAVSPPEQDIFRVRNILLHQAHFSNRVADSALRFYKIWLEVARTGKGWDAMQRENEKVKTAGWYTWVQPPPADSWPWTWYRKAGNYHFIPYWEKVRIPTLLLYGEKDEITPVGPSARKIGSALEKAGNRTHQLIIFPNAIHNLTEVKKEGDLWAKTTPGYYETIYRWIMRNCRKPMAE
jgi:pimeloyl-ACP methyl ester carboxylesterase